MKAFFLLTFCFLLSTLNLLADEFIVKSFKQIDNKILTNSQKVYDDNDELCAIIMVRTSLIDLGISASTPIVGNAKWEEGDFKVYVTAGTRMIKFYKKGFETLEYIFSQRPEQGVFYLLELEYRRTDVTAAGNTMGFVLINSEPPGADVFINDEATGMQTPFQMPYNEGYYNYSLKMVQYLDYSGDFTIKSDETKELDVKLKPDFGALSLAYSPAQEVEILIDGKKVEDNTPISIERLSPGIHTLSVSKLWYQTSEQTFTINREQTTTLNVGLKPDFGSLNLSYFPVEGVTVLIDGIRIDKSSPISINKLSPGNHTLSVSKDRYDTHEQTFTINREQTETLNVNLNPNFGGLNLNVTPLEGVTVLIDGIRIDQSSPISIDKLSPGNHTLNISKDRYDTHEQTFTINREQTETLNVNLRPNFGGLNLSFTPVTAVTISIDGTPSTHNSPYIVEQLPPGTHALMLSKNQYLSKQQEFTINKGETTTIEIDLLANFGDLLISTIPEVNAKVLIDNKEYTETTPLTLKQFAAGKHTLRLSKSMYLNHEQEFTIEKGVPFTMEVALVPTFGTIEITADSDADIYIDKQKMGSGSYTGRLLKGIHLIEIKKEKYTSQSKQLEIVVGETHTEQFTLVPKLGVLSVMTTPAKADIYLNNELQGQSPKFVNNLIIGTYTLKLQKQGFALTEKQVEITENQTTTINETLASAIEVKITSNPAGAKLYIDGQYIGITPQSVSLSFEEHSLKLEKDKYKDYQTIKTITTTTNLFILDMVLTITDQRDGQIYTSVTIGKQTWMAKNLNYKTSDSWCYDDKQINCNKYGRLYSWEAAKKACPSGWHLPSDDEWKQLEMSLGMSQSEANKTGYRGTNEGKKMKSTIGWAGNGNGTNSSGFNALPGGYRNSSGSFYGLGSNGYWWSSSEYSGSRAWYRRLYYDGDLVFWFNNYKSDGFSIRCLKD